MLKILCFGDSITLGEKDIEQGGWANRLKIDYFKKYQNNITQDVIVYNLGIGGETSDGLVKRFETEFNFRQIKGQDTLVILAFGANDIVIHKNKNIVPENYFIRNLTSCINYAQKYNSQILLLSLLPISNSIDGKINQHGKLRFNQDIEKYNQTIEMLALQKSCFFLDVYNAFVKNSKQTLLSADGVHPNSNGHQIIFSLVKNHLLKILAAKY